MFTSFTRPEQALGNNDCKTEKNISTALTQQDVKKFFLITSHNQWKKFNSTSDLKSSNISDPPSSHAFDDFISERKYHQMFQISIIYFQIDKDDGEKKTVLWENYED